QLELLEAERQLTAAEAELVNLRATLESQRLNQAATVATACTAYNEALRQATTARELAQRDLIAENEIIAVQERAVEAETRCTIERERLDVLTRGQHAQLAVQEAQIGRLRSIVGFRRQQLASMEVVAGADGVVRDIPLEVGQWVNPGDVLARVIEPGRLKAVLRIPETQASDVQLGQRAMIDTRNGIVEGVVVRSDPAAENGTVTVDVRLIGDLPQGARPDLSVDGTIEIERLEDVLYVGRPAYGQPNSTVGLFKVAADGQTAERVTVRLGRSSVNTVEIVSGLQRGDLVILSDMSAYDDADRVRIQ
ncbi:MAG: efflux RND transporter periplasmic adaptor subunit, partial [Longimicrobiales bacterium]